ncbi:MAG: transposase [Bryobacteraceae bacterium]
MARLARVIAPGAPHHVTQRGNGRRVVFESDSDRLVYMDLLRQHCCVHSLALVGYCLMSNHVHLIVIPARPNSLPLALKHIHGRYAAYCNALHASSGHLWQGRYYSCPLDQRHFWAALRYTELNPVRAGLAAEPEAYPWSSAAAHCGSADASLDMRLWRESWTPATWREYLGTAGAAWDDDAIRRNTHTGRPLGAEHFVAALERDLQRRLAPEKGGRRTKSAADVGQLSFGFQEAPSSR